MILRYEDEPAFHGFWSEETWPEMGFSGAEFDAWLKSRHGADYRKKLGFKEHDTVLGRDFASVTGAAARSLINAARTLRNKVVIASGVVTVYAEDDTTVIWTGAVTQTAGANPITAVDPT